jgi:hypothetical protein
MIVPLLLGWSMTESGGKIGLLIATITLFAAGECLCIFAPTIAAPVIVGAVVVALSQLYPILQMIAGLAAVGIGRRLGLMLDADPVGVFRSGAGGFVVTVVTGSILIAESAAVGLLIRVITPNHWWSARVNNLKIGMA